MNLPPATLPDIASRLRCDDITALLNIVQVLALTAPQYPALREGIEGEAAALMDRLRAERPLPPPPEAEVPAAPEVEVPYQDCEIKTDEQGIRHAISKDGCVSVLPDGEVKLFMRNAIKFRPNGNKEHLRMLVAELDGVRVYVKGDQVIVTKQDLYL